MLKKSIYVGLLAIGLGSCVVSQSYQLTGQPVGTKVGVAKTTFKNRDYTVRTAAKNGKIETIGAVEIRVSMFLIITFFKTTVYGE